MPDLDAQLRALAEHRLGQVPLRPVDPVTTDQDQRETNPPRRGMNGRLTRLLVAAGALLMLSLVAAWVINALEETDVDDVVTFTRRSAMYDRGLSERDDWAGPLTEQAQPGTFAVAEVGTGEPILVADTERAERRFTPASTFKLLNALIILETGAIDDIDTVVPWDGVTREVEAWNQDHSLRTAIQDSAVWVFQELARDVGPETMATNVEAAEYGNADTGGAIDSFWLDGDLRTSAVDQLAFLEQLASSRLPFDELQQGQVLASMPRLDGPDSSISYKTGTALGADQPVAWLVGIVNTPAGQWVFAYNVDIPIVNGEPQPPSVDDRLDVVLALLESAGVVNEA